MLGNTYASRSLAMARSGEGSQIASPRLPPQKNADDRLGVFSPLSANIVKDGRANAKLPKYNESTNKASEEIDRDLPSSPIMAIHGVETSDLRGLSPSRPSNRSKPQNKAKETRKRIIRDATLDTEDQESAIPDHLSRKRGRKSARRLTEDDETDADTEHPSIPILRASTARSSHQENCQTDEVPRLPAGPRFARLGRKSVRSREVIGFMASSSPPAAPPVRNTGSDAPESQSGCVHQKAQPLAAYCLDKPTNMENLGSESNDGISEETGRSVSALPMPTPIITSPSAIRRVPASVRDGQTAISSSTGGFPEARIDVAQGRAASEHHYDPTRQQALELKASGERSAQPPPSLTSLVGSSSSCPRGEKSVSATATLDQPSVHDCQRSMQQLSGESRPASRQISAPPVAQGDQSEIASAKVGGLSITESDTLVAAGTVLPRGLCSRSFQAPRPG